MHYKCNYYIIMTDMFGPLT